MFSIFKRKEPCPKEVALLAKMRRELEILDNECDEIEEETKILAASNKIRRARLEKLGVL